MRRVIELIREVEKNNREKIAKFIEDIMERDPMFKDVMDGLGKL